MSTCNDKQATLTERANALVARLSQDSKALAADIQEKAKGIDPDIDTTGPDLWVGIDFDVSWKRVDFSLDLPEVKMVDQRWALDLPEVTLKDQTIIFHTPSVRMKTVKTGEYPETKCSMVTKDIGFGVKIDVPECTVWWSPIFIDIPEPFMQEQKIVMGIPEFWMERTEMVLGVPEFSMKTSHFALDLPQFTAKNINVEAKNAKAKGDALALEASIGTAKLKERFRENAKMALGADVASLFDCYQRELMERKNEAMQRFDSGVNLIQATITAMVANKIGDQDEPLVSVKQSLVDLIAKRDEFARVIELKFVELSDQQQIFFNKMIGGSNPIAVSAEG